MLILYIYYQSKDEKNSAKECSTPPPKTEFFSFQVRTGDHDVAEWSAVHINGCLYVHVPDEEMQPGSKEWYALLYCFCSVQF
jgi:hypothetical protein